MASLKLKLVPFNFVFDVYVAGVEGVGGRPLSWRDFYPQNTGRLLAGRQWIFTVILFCMPSKTLLNGA